jgi:hypothetical protein
MELLRIDMKTLLKFRFDESFNSEKNIFHQEFENFKKYHFENNENYRSKIILQKESMIYLVTAFL